MYLKIQIQWILSCGKLENWDWTLRRDTTENSQDASGAKLNSGKKRQSGGIIQKGEPHERNPCAPDFQEQPPEETSRQAGCTSKVAWNLARKYASSSRRQLRFILLWRRQRHISAYVCLLWIRELQCTMLSKENWAQIQWILWQGPKPHKRLTAIGSSAIKRVSTSFCSWSRSVRNSAITRWNASDSVASPALLKTRILIRVENGETPRLANNGNTSARMMDNFVLLVGSRLSPNSSRSLSSTSRSKDQANYSRKLGTLSNSVTTRSDKHVCEKAMLTDPDKQATGNREPAHETNKEDPTQGIPVWFTALHSKSRGPGAQCSHIPLKERTQIRKVML